MMDDPVTWPPLAELRGLAGEPFTAAGSSPALAGACDDLIGLGRWTTPVACGAVVVRSPQRTGRTRGTTSRAAMTGPVVRRRSAAGARGAGCCALSPPPAANNREADSAAHGHGDSEHAKSGSRDDAGAGERVALPVGRRVRVESGRCARDRQHDTADRDRDKQQSEQARTPVPPMRVLYT